jgi:S1-C subfamily serine protease
MANVLSELSEGLAQTVAAAGKSVVRVEGRRRLPASGFAWEVEGVIATANHVLESDDEIEVGLADGQSVQATLVGRDPSTDLAVLRAETPGLSPPGWAEPDGVRVGNIALALGRPGRYVQATLGIVSALGDGWRTRAGGKIDRYLQTDVVMYPGFSGGPLVDASGRVIGLNTSALLRGVTVSIPLPTIRRVVETLLAHGRVRRGYLGVGAQVVPLPDAVDKGLDQETGLLLVSVEPDSPAQRGGLMLGDTIVSLNGQPVRHLDDLLSLLSGESVGTSAPVRIVRGGQLQELSVTIGERS